MATTNFLLQLGLEPACDFFSCLEGTTNDFEAFIATNKLIQHHEGKGHNDFVQSLRTLITEDGEPTIAFEWLHLDFIAFEKKTQYYDWTELVGDYMVSRMGGENEDFWNV